MKLVDDAGHRRRGIGVGVVAAIIILLLPRPSWGAVESVQPPFGSVIQGGSTSATVMLSASLGCVSAVAGMGMGRAGVALGVARHPTGVGEGVIGVLDLISGAAFFDWPAPGLAGQSPGSSRCRCPCGRYAQTSEAIATVCANFRH